jgi:predicted AAA+ superfamily ATPase
LASLPASIVVGDDTVWSNFGGAFAENFVLQQLRSLGFEEEYYWTSNADNPKQPKGKSELDFILSDENAIYPVEVKSGGLFSRNIAARFPRVLCLMDSVFWSIPNFILSLCPNKLQQPDINE